MGQEEGILGQIYPTSDNVKSGSGSLCKPFFSLLISDITG